MTARDDYDRLVAERPELQLGDSHIGHSLAMDAYADRLEAALAAAVEREERLREIERCARGVVRTAHPNVAEHMVADGWWNALVAALATEEGEGVDA